MDYHEASAHKIGSLFLSSPASTSRQFNVRHSRERDFKKRRIGNILASPGAALRNHLERSFRIAVGAAAEYTVGCRRIPPRIWLIDPDNRSIGRKLGGRVVRRTERARRASDSRGSHLSKDQL